MKMKYLLTIAFLMTIIFNSNSQSATFVTLPKDSRIAGMGGAGYVLESPFGVQYNIAANMVSQSINTQVGATYLLWQPERSNSSLFNISAFNKFKNIGIGLGVRYNSLSVVQSTDENGNIIGELNPNEYSIDIGAGYKINSLIAIGVTLRYISSNMDNNNNGSALSTDASIVYHLKDINIGLGWSNFGTKISYGASQYNLPMRIRSGVSYNLINSKEQMVLTVADLAYQLNAENNGVVGSLGVEYTYKEKLSFRTGYHFEDKMVGSSYATLGFGVQLYHLKLDMAYFLASKENPSSGTMLFTLKWCI